MPTPASIAFAQLLDGTPYRPLRPLGEGGMGQVVEAEHIALKKRVVVKIVLEHLAEHAQIADRMRLEAQTLAALGGHRHLPEVSDFGTTRDGRPYIAMELLRGETFGQALRERGRLPVGEAAEYVMQALDGIAHAHEAGLVHRDIKLENLFLAIDADGKPVVKVLDFGVAKVVQATTRAPAPLQVPTEVGTQIGTPHYFAPEQALGATDVDARADIYAMGCVLYTLITGQKPFQGVRGHLEIARAHLERMPPRPSEVAPDADIPPALERVVERALAKRRENRFQTAREMIEAIRDAVSPVGPVPSVEVDLDELAPTAGPVRAEVAREVTPVEPLPPRSGPAAPAAKPFAAGVVIASACIFALLTTLLVFALGAAR